MRRYISPHRLLTFTGRFVLASVVLLWAACSRPESTPAAKAPATYNLRGEIVGVQVAKGILLVHHEEIPGFMPAMTMEFTAPGFDLSTAREGQKITARMSDRGGDTYQLDEVKVLASVDDQAVAAGALALRQETSVRGKNAYREVGEVAPSFTLYNQDGKATAFDHFRGKRVVLNFIFTRCPVPTMCPASTTKMMALQAAAKKAGVKDLELVSISFDSAFDTPPVLKAYADARGIDTSNFSFLTGPESAIRDLLLQFGVIAEPGENLFKHTLSTLLIGPTGKILHRVDGSTWAPEEFLNRL